jgi:type IV pilus assembly protein PilC
MIQNGSLFQSMENTGLFPNYMLHMVRIGEQTGNLDEVMQSLQEHYEREESIRVSIQNALIYPFIMAGMIIVVILILLVRVMPIFNQVFKQLGT